jgi:hypothetical protein
MVRGLRRSFVEVSGFHGGQLGDGSSLRDAMGSRVMLLARWMAY